MKRILFRADAKPSIGIGDLMSLINLSHYFNPREWECFFMIKAYSAGIKLAKRIEKKYVFILDESISIENEVDEINHVVQIHKIDILFFEITDRRLSKYTGLTNNVKKACVNFNDHLLNGIDLVINWDVDAVKYMHQSSAPNALFLLGPKYVILPKQFYSLHDRRYKDKVETLLISMGGADEFNFTMKVVKIIIENNVKVSLNIIVGSGYENIEKLKSLLKNSFIDYKIKHDVGNMFNEYINCDFAIGAGGLTSSELVATKTPSALIATYEHQIARCKFFDKKRLVKYLGYKDFDSEELLRSINNPTKPNCNFLFETSKIINNIESICAN